MATNEILNMQVRLFRKFTQRHQLVPTEAIRLFDRFDILGFIAECYELLHVSGDESILDDVDSIMRNRGYQI